MTIPKTIHYCWLSGNPIPAAYQKYMSLWKTKLPDYQFMLWDTQRFDINKTTWTKQAFDAGLYAFAADYIRLFAIYNYGGIYLDMDIEIIKPFDDLLNTDLMIAYENHISENLEAGCFGAIKGHEYIKKCMEYFETTDFFDPSETGKIMGMSVTERSEYLDPVILPEIMKRAMENFKDKKYRIYPREYFTAKNIVTGAIEKTRNTFAVHHFATQYHSDEWRKNRKTEQAINRAFGEKTILSKIVRKILGIKNRIARQGISKSIEYYFNKYVVNKNNRKKANNIRRKHIS